MRPEKKQVLDLTDEFLTDVATAFFDTRCELDAMIEAFEATVASLRQEAQRVATAAATLCTVLIDDTAVRTLFDRLDVDPAPFTAAAREAKADLRITLRMLWGRRRRYRFVVSEAYHRLAAAVARYRDGLPAGANPRDEPAKEPAYYHLVHEMARLINQRIEAVNRHCAPSELLHYVKQFDPDRIEREDITGAGAGSCGLDDRLCYPPLDFNALQLPVFPPLVSPQQARDAINPTADAVYKARPDAVARLLDSIKRTVPSFPKAGPDR